MLILVHSVTLVLSSRPLSNNLNMKIHKTIILPVVLYSCETWTLTLREGRRLRVFERKILRRVFGPNRGDGNGEWKRLHNENFVVCAVHQISLGMGNGKGFTMGTS